MMKQNQFNPYFIKSELLHFDEIENVSREQLTNIAKDLFGEEITVVFPVPTVKKIGTR